LGHLLGSGFLGGDFLAGRARTPQQHANGMKNKAVLQRAGGVVVRLVVMLILVIGSFLVFLRERRRAPADLGSSWTKEIGYAHTSMARRIS